MIAVLASVLLAVAANEEYVPPDDWRNVVALPAGILIFFGGIFLLLKSNLGTRRAYLVEAACFFGFMTILSLFWGLGAPGTPQFTGPQNLPGQQGDHYTPKWVAFAGDSTLADERFPIVKQFPEGFEQVGGDEQAAEEGAAGGAAEGAVAAEEAGVPADPSAGADEVGNFFREERGGARLIADDWVLDGEPYLATGDDGEEIVAATFAKPFALNDEGEIPETRDGRPLFEEEQVGQPIPEDFEVPGNVEDDVAQLLTPGRYTAFGFYDPGFPMFPSLVMMALSIAGLILHALLLGWDENRARERAVEEIVVEREPVGAAR